LRPGFKRGKEEAKLGIIVLLLAEKKIHAEKSAPTLGDREKRRSSLPKKESVREIAFSSSVIIGEKKKEDARRVVHPYSLSPERKGISPQEARSAPLLAPSGGKERTEEEERLSDLQVLFLSGAGGRKEDRNCQAPTAPQPLIHSLLLT